MKPTALEQAILEWFVVAYPNAVLAEQVAQCEVAEREESSIGFFTSFEVPERGSKLVSEEGESSFVCNECGLFASELEMHADCLLHVRQGRIDYLEVYAIGEGHPLQVTTFELRALPMNYIAWNSDESQ